ncbi:MAG: hypothetical protein PHT41_07940 [Candidatus Omnitrophica bacterium]|nr:hypothetical protein [Candidatus Omnitrophota bacterium]MDD5237794.1 hypothetical protein [Candidatus Omnitrophota bacterium]
MRFMVQGVKFKVLLLVTSYSLLVTLIGCDAFVRKFTRKPKKTSTHQEEMVLAPQEYKPTMNSEQAYHQYFMFWKSWQDELIESLLQKGSQKKQIDCVNEAIKNIFNVKALLNKEKQKKLDIYIMQLKDLQEAISKDTYGTNSASNAQSADRIKKNILRFFSYNKVSKDINPVQ